LYGAHVVWHHELATPEAALERLRYLRQTVAHACERALYPEPGPVHLNAPFRDPLPPVEDGKVCADEWRENLDEPFFAHLRDVAPAACPDRGMGCQPMSENHGLAARATQAGPTLDHLASAWLSNPDAQPLQIRQGAYLPHWTRDGAIYAVTFRLADSLPQSVLKTWLLEREDIMQTAAQQCRPLTACELERLDQLHSEKVEAYLDAGAGECHLRRDEIAATIRETLNHFDGQRYRLHAWCVMPNHVHVIVQPVAGCPLEKIVHTWKSYTANKANSLLNRAGAFWQPEYYDHLIRDEADYSRATDYITQNPAKARLANWKWLGSGMGCQPMSEDHGLAARATSCATIRALIVAGPGSAAADVFPIAVRTGMPVLADVLSPTRHQAEKSVLRVSAYDAILRDERAAGSLAPHFVLCIGGWPTSKILRAWLEKTQPEIVMVAPAPRNRDALHGRTRRVAHVSHGFDVMAATATAVEPAYRNAWEKAETAACAALDNALASLADTDLFEPGAVWLLARHLPESTPLFVANSMPVRDAEYFWPANDRRARFYFNRGANGIDGTLSTALGIAHGNARPAVLLTGDLSLLHDANGFLIGGNARFRGGLTIVLVNNRGGGIFEHLPVASFEPPFEDYFATPQQVDFARLCEAHGVEHHLIRDWAQFAHLIAALPPAGVRVLEIRATRKTDAARRKALLAQAGG
ncbi:MAG: transposase, partial [Opitutaceae bacterium]|nr:transposase [Opitutaceae bacterium]